MANKNIQIKDVNGNLLFPKTYSSIVINNNGDNLGDVEAGAQVNLIEKVKVNGTELSIKNKEVNVEIPDAPEYSITKATTEDGFSATYQLTKDGTAVGEKINIPKDMVVQSGSVKTCTAANNPVEGFKKGDKYIDLLLANTDDQHIYILVSDLVDIYTAGDGVSVNNNEISVDIEFLKDTFATKDDVSGNIDDIQDDITNIQDDITDLQDNKADKATTLAGYGIIDAYTKTETDNAITEAIAGCLTYEEIV